MTLKLQKNGLFPPEPFSLRFFKNTTKGLTPKPEPSTVEGDGEAQKVRM
jgi:hypothetical protein